MESKEGALYSPGSNRDAEESKDIFLRKGIRLFERFSGKLIAQHRYRSLRDGASRAVPANIMDMAIADRKTNSDLVAAGGVTFGVLYGPSPLTPLPLRQERRFAAWVPVVVENVFGVEIHVRE